MSLDDGRNARTPATGDRRWWTAVPLIVLLVIPLAVVLIDSIPLALTVIVVGIAAASFAVRMAVRPPTG